MCFNAYFCSQSEARRAEMQGQMAFSFELIIGWLLRLFNQKCWVLPIIVLSLWFLRCKAPRGVWDVGSKFRLLYSKRTTEMIAIDLGNKIQQPCYYPTWASRKVALCVFDNCLVKFGASYHEGISLVRKSTLYYQEVDKPITKRERTMTQCVPESLPFESVPCCCVVSIYLV